MLDSQDLASLQSSMNAEAGDRHVPARTIPVPMGLARDSSELASAPYSPAWNLAPADERAWGAVKRGMADRLEPVLAKVRADLRVAIRHVTIGGVGAFILRPNDIPDQHRRKLVLFLHGGGYVLGGGTAGTMEATLLAAYGRYTVLSLDYALAPDRRHPAALEDALAAWRSLTTMRDARDLVIGGLSAGGGLALALLMRIRDEGLPMPAAASLGTPWADMTRTGDSYATNEWLDNVLVSYDGYLSRAGRLYAAGHDLRHPSLSPINGDFQGLPPCVLLTGTRDLFLSNTVRTHRKLRDAGVDADLHVFEGISHAQFALSPGADVTLSACAEVAGFYERYLRSTPR